MAFGRKPQKNINFLTLQEVYALTRLLPLQPSPNKCCSDLGLQMSILEEKPKFSENSEWARTKASEQVLFVKINSSRLFCYDI